MTTGLKLAAMAIHFSRFEDTYVVPETFRQRWAGSAGAKESTLHQVSPYIGKIKSSMAAALVSEFTKPGDLVYDPFSGSGTVALEAWIARRRVIANDLSPYAFLLTRAKLFPPTSVETALAEMDSASKHAAEIIGAVDLRKVPSWVRDFFHAETLREVIAWKTALEERGDAFLYACLLGILHHQRPGFLSFPSSHTVPYLRLKKFPRWRFPKLYEYRAIRERLEAKVKRALKRVPNVDYQIHRLCVKKNASRFIPEGEVRAIITSPPYMRQLDYGRDNRLRLWFLGVENWKNLDVRVSPREEAFLGLMRACLKSWKKVLATGGRCVLVLGDTFSRTYEASLPDAIQKMAELEVGGYLLDWKVTETIPNERRVRRGCSGSLSETVLVLKRCK